MSNPLSDSVFGYASPLVDSPFSEFLLGGAGPQPTGTITFLDGASALSTVPLVNGTATFSTSSLASGSHNMTAQYSGDSYYASSVSNTVVQVVNPVTAPNVQFDAVSSTHITNNAGTTLSWTHTPTGVPTAVAVTAYNYDGSTAITGVTYGGRAMTRQEYLLDAFGQNRAGYIFGLVNPPAGPQSIVITYSSTGAYCEAAAITVTGSSTTTCFSASHSVSLNVINPSLSVAANNNDLVVDVLGISGAGTISTPSGAQTQRWGPYTDASLIGQGSTAPATGAVTMAWTLNQVAPVVLSAASFAHA